MTLIIRAVHPIRRPDPPEGSDRIRPETGRPDQVTGRWRVICSKNRLRRVGLGFPPQNSKKPDPTDVPSISRKISRIQQKFPEFGDIFQIPASNFQIPTSNFQILATNFHISATYQVDLVIFRPNLVKSHWI